MILILTGRRAPGGLGLSKRATQMLSEQANQSQAEHEDGRSREGCQCRRATLKHEVSVSISTLPFGLEMSA